jgi:hypothetical protein
MRVMHLDLTDEETAALLRELDSIIDGDRYFLSPRIKTLRAIRAKIRPEPVHQPLPPPPKRYEPPRATAAQRRRRGRSTQGGLPTH